MRTEKRCSACKQVKLISAFSKHQSSPDGLYYHCKECDKVYQAQYRKKHPPKRYEYDPIVVSSQATKPCRDCKQEKLYAAFNKDRSKKDGYAPECKECHRQRMKGYKPLLTPEEKMRRREEYLRKHSFKKTPIDAATYRKVHAQQQGKCAICGNVEIVKNQHKVKRLAIDHCHITGQFRGLLCTNCNLGLGYFKDNPDLLAKAIVYLLQNAATKSAG